MSINTYIRQIRQDIADNKLVEALHLLRALLQKTPLFNEAIQQSARYADLREQVRLGTVSHQEANLTQNQIRWGVLELLSEMERQESATSLNSLLDAVEEVSKRPDLQQEVTNAISVINSKNIVIGSSPSAGRDLHIGDIYIASPTGQLPKQPTQQSIQPISLKIIQRDKSLRWYQRWFFGFLKKSTRQELALKAQGIFDADERRYFLNTLQHYLPLYFREGSKDSPRPFTDTFFQSLNAESNDGKFYLLLGETGAGKSTALLELFTQFALSERKYDIVFTTFGKGLAPIFQLPNPEKTVLLLDGIDEAPGMEKDPEAFFTKVENGARNFAKVIISCRTQFFVNKASERAKTSTNPPKNYHKLYLYFLEPEVVQRYLGGIYPVGKPEYIAAMAIIRQTGDLFRRPLLLYYIADMVEKKEGFLFFKTGQNSRTDSETGAVTSYEVYETILEKWMDREKRLNPSVEGDYRQILYEVSMRLALSIFYPENLKYVYYLDLNNIAEKYRLPINETLLCYRSLLRRNEDGYYNFAHRSFKEFFFAQLLYDGLIEEEEFSFDAHEDTAQFYNEMGEVRYFQQITDEARRKIHHPGIIPFPSIKNTCLPRPLIAFCHLEGIPISEDVMGLFGALIKKTQYMTEHLDCLTDLAEYLVREGLETISNEHLSSVCKRYNKVYIGDLIKPFFFCQKGDSFHFIHRAFAEYLCLRDMILEENSDDSIEAAARFPFDQLRFTRLFAQEIRWLKFLPYHREVSLLINNYDVSKEEYEKSDATIWFEYNQQISIATFSDIYQRLKEGDGRLCIKAGSVADNDFLNFIPFAEQVQELNLAHNNLQGDIELGHFTRLKAVRLAGNPGMKLVSFPASLKCVILDKKEEKVIVPPDFKGIVRCKEDIVLRLAGDSLSIPNMVAIEGGRFWMGSKEEDKNAQTDEMPFHLMEVSNFFIAQYPVTVREFACFVHETGHVTQAEREGWGISSYWNEDTLTFFLNIGADWTHDVYGKPIDEAFALHPVIQISWHDALAYCAWISQKKGKQYRLPSEAEWEYSAIGGQRSGKRDESGNIVRQTEYAGSDDFTEVAWCFDRFSDSSAASSQYSTRHMGQLKPNQLGLYDMSGNVWEWCQDWYGDYEEIPEKDYKGPEEGSYRVARGGGWDDDAEDCRTADRGLDHPDYRNYFLGFRPVFVP